jgi:hypothetical protein
MQNDQDSTVDAECAERVRIPVLDIAGYEAAASLLAVLAYPDDKKARIRLKRAASPTAGARDRKRARTWSVVKSPIPGGQLRLTIPSPV